MRIMAHKAVDSRVGLAKEAQGGKVGLSPHESLPYYHYSLVLARIEP